MGRGFPQAVSFCVALALGVASFGCERIVLDFEGRPGEGPLGLGGEGGEPPLPPPAPELSVEADLDLSVARPSGRDCDDGGEMAMYQVDAYGGGELVLREAPQDDCLIVGDEVLLVRLQGEGDASSVGRNELLRVKSIALNRLEFVSAPLLAYGEGEVGSWQTGGGSVVLQRVPSFSRVTVAQGATLTGRPFDRGGSGILAFRVLGDLRLSGAISMNGAGFRGGAERDEVLMHGLQGESISGSGFESTGANVGGGGGGLGDQTTTGCVQDGNAGGGGGHVAPGGDAIVSDRCAGEGRGRGGVAYADAGKLFLGSGGGSGGVDNVRVDNPPGAPGGSGGGIIWILAQSMTGSGRIEARGAEGVGDAPDFECMSGGSQSDCYDHSGPGGGGAGGSIRLTTSQFSGILLDVAGGRGGNGADGATGNGGDGGAGLIEAPAM